ncbi:sulfite exporter TauE/SafE family protein [Arthrobacter sp. efr-133-TYG-120]|uniref:sulfite exporter TauE/SafE family protein n=1 Tax=Arthrobacter sp. efr-133-TYG-120 TaxID=3040280 RepID=UPI002550CED8|nr:sulfite exporter TauE/SafE family protein [Arthrobacter sp. efr-133-TYG-120]
MTRTSELPPITPARPAPSPLVLILLGIVTGYLSGLFGVGGGVVVVPALLLLGVDQRIAVGSSVAAILPTSIVGAAGYAISGNVDWLAGLMLALGIIAGAQLGSYLLARLPKDLLFWLFLVFMTAVVVSLWSVIPQRDDAISLTPISAIALILTGIVTGIFSALLGVGGGIIIVPILIFFFGASDLIAKGTSLLMMVPGSISATIGNTRRRNFNLRIAAFVGISACTASPLGLVTAHAISPFWSNAAFSVLMAGVAIQLLVKRLRTRWKRS